MINAPDISSLQPFGRILSSLGRNYLHALNAKLHYLDIDRNYYALLLLEAGEGNITQNELAFQLETDKVSIVRIIDYLAEKGYVNRAKSPTDKRKYCLTLTDKAKSALPGIKESLNDITELTFKGISESQKAAFYLTLDTIKNNLRKANTTGI